MSRERAPKNSKLLFSFFFLFPSIDSARALTEIAVRNSESAQSKSRASAKPEQHRHARARPLSCLSPLLLLRARAHQPSAAEQSSGEPAKDCRCARARQQPNRLAYRTPHTARAPTHSTVGVVLVLVLARLASPRLAQRTKIDTLHLTPFPPHHLHLHPARPPPPQSCPTCPPPK